MRLRRILGGVVVAICLGVPIVEGFDRWDNTLQDGNDTEANLVLAAVCVGFALTITTALLARLRGPRINNRIAVSLPGLLQASGSLVSPTPTVSPPTPLRI